ncbi:hypothetical protein EVAR_69672_1 [Eumeta japonica]|uniref:Uncharacterized protein n=1 Tax=Eumeta variegata TaxID=151549 RepID=A0A4C1ZPY3_EUMVA|nr:hypothetical protein EVAR_69672_1 [Eumeta japonica]
MFDKNATYSLVSAVGVAARPFDRRLLSNAVDSTRKNQKVRICRGRAVPGASLASRRRRQKAVPCNARILYAPPFIKLYYTTSTPLSSSPNIGILIVDMFAAGFTFTERKSSENKVKLLSKKLGAPSGV